MYHYCYFKQAMYIQHRMVTNAHLKPVWLEDNTPLAVEQRLGQPVEIQISLGTIRIEYVVERTTKKNAAI